MILNDIDRLMIEIQLSRGMTRVDWLLAKLSELVSAQEFKLFREMVK